MLVAHSREKFDVCPESGTRGKAVLFLIILLNANI